MENIDLIIPSTDDETLSSIGENLDASIEMVYEYIDLTGVPVSKIGKEKAPAPKSVKLKRKKKKIEESFLKFLSIEKKAMIKQQMIEELKKNKRALLSLLTETEAEANHLWECLRKAKKETDKHKEEFEQMKVNDVPVSNQITLPEEQRSASTVSAQLNQNEPTSHVEPIAISDQEQIAEVLCQEPWAIEVQKKLLEMCEPSKRIMMSRYLNETLHF